MSRLDGKATGEIVIALILIVFAIASRLVPHPANFVPVGAVALLSGAVLSRRLALSLPLVAMIVSDVILGLHPLLGFTWGSYALITLLAGYWFNRLTVSRVLLGSFGASTLFFLVTNFGVWAEGRLYAHSLADLIQCYYNALPFFRNTLLGDLAYSGLLFGAYGLVQIVRKNGVISVSSNT